MYKGIFVNTQESKDLYLLSDISTFKHYMDGKLGSEGHCNWNGSC